MSHGDLYDVPTFERQSEERVEALNAIETRGTGGGFHNLQRSHSMQLNYECSVSANTVKEI